MLWHSMHSAKAFKHREISFGEGNIFFGFPKGLLRAPESFYSDCLLWSLLTNICNALITCSWECTYCVQGFCVNSGVSKSRTIIGHFLHNAQCDTKQAHTSSQIRTIGDVQGLTGVVIFTSGRDESWIWKKFKTCRYWDRVRAWCSLTIKRWKVKLLSTLPFKVVIFSIPFNLLLLFPNVILSRFSWFSLYSLRTVVVDRFINHLSVSIVYTIVYVVCIGGSHTSTHFRNSRSRPFTGILSLTPHSLKHIAYVSFSPITKLGRCKFPFLWIVQEKPIRRKAKGRHKNRRYF